MGQEKRFNGAEKNLAGLSRREKNEIMIVFLLKHDTNRSISLKINDLGYTCDRCDSKNH